MATEVKIPSLGESISSGILASWQVKDGDWVEEGQALFELETDKITSEGVAEVGGRIELKAQEGDEVEVGSVVAVIDEEAEKPEAGESSGDEEEAKDPGKRTESRETEGGDDGAHETDQSAAGEAGSEADGDPAYPPSVRRLADESGIDPATVKGTGKGGRVTKSDMQAAIEDRRQKETPSGKSAPVPEEGTEKPAPDEKARAGREEPEKRTSRRKLSPLRRTIARRLVEVQQQTAMLTTFNEADMGAVISLRKQHQEAFRERHGIKLGFMSFFTRAVVKALQEVPQINAMLDGDEVVNHHYYDIGIAVSTDRGLVVPVVRDCDRKSFSRIEQDIQEYAKRAQNGKLAIEDLQGGVFTITNGGVFGSLLSTPILNSPQSAILGMHTIQQRPVAVNGEVVIRPMMYLALSYDHRIVDGREAVTFLVSVKRSIEDPTRLLFDT